MYHSDKELFKHIFDEIVFIENTTKHVTFETYIESDIYKRAFARSIEIIGEAVKNISTDIINRYSNIPWRNISGMRDKLIHGYFSVNYKLVWDVAINIIPEFKTSLENIVIDNPEIFR